MTTVYEMYVANGNRAGFWIKRYYWTTTIARVVAIDGQEAGELPEAAFSSGRVRACFYDKRTREFKNCGPVPQPNSGEYSQVFPVAFWKIKPTCFCRCH